MARGRSDSFRQHFLGVHLFNPPQVIVGTEVIPHPETDPQCVKNACEMLAHRLGRKVIVTAIGPLSSAIASASRCSTNARNSASEHGVAFIDYVVGPHTGRAMAPLATIDLVGWDVHKAIVDNVYANTEDEAHRAFRLPAFMERGIKEGQLGDKTPKRRRLLSQGRQGGRRAQIRKPDHDKPLEKPTPIPFVEKMKQFNREGRYARPSRCSPTRAAPRPTSRAGRFSATSAMRSIASARWRPVGGRRRHHHVVRFQLGAAERDRRFASARRTSSRCSAATISMVPPVVEKAASNGGKLYRGGMLDYGRTLVG